MVPSDLGRRGLLSAWSVRAIWLYNAGNTISIYVESLAVVAVGMDFEGPFEGDPESLKVLSA